MRRRQRHYAEGIGDGISNLPAEAASQAGIAQGINNDEWLQLGRQERTNAQEARPNENLNHKFQTVHIMS